MILGRDSEFDMPLIPVHLICYFNNMEVQCSYSLSVRDFTLSNINSVFEVIIPCT